VGLGRRNQWLELVRLRRDATVQHTYDMPGTYTPVVRVTDDGGAANTAFTTIAASSAGTEPPVATLTADPTSGAAPLTVNFDASAPATRITTSRITSGISTATAPMKATAFRSPPRSTSTQVRVHTMPPCVSRTMTAVGYSHAADRRLWRRAKWHAVTVVQDTSIEWPSLLEVDGRPAIAYSSGSGETGHLEYLRANDALGQAWPGENM